MRRLNRHCFFAAALLLGACANNPTVGKDPMNGVDPGMTPQTPSTPDPGPGGELAAGSLNTTFDHELDERDPFDILRQKQEEGAPLVATRLHSCQKMSYATLGHLLTSRGVNLSATAKPGMPPTAGELYKGGAQALGVANFPARTREATQSTAAGTTKLMDIFLAAADEIIANLPNVQACQVNGQPSRMFDDSGNCTIEGVSCLMGTPATQPHLDLCNQAIVEASSREVGQRLAVGALLAAAHTCE